MTLADVPDAPLPALGSSAASPPMRPPSVTFIAWLYIVMGAIGFLYHLPEVNPQQPFENDALWVELVRLLAVVSGVFMLRGHDWARWLGLAWIGYHVVLSSFHTVPELVMHGVFLGVFAYLLLRASANRYFRAT
jgi:hypothetical protein